MEKVLENFFWVLPLAFVGILVWRYFRKGSLTGALIGARIASTVGEIDLAAPLGASQVLKVHVLEPGADATSQVALAIVSKAPLAASLVPIKLSREQAQHLATLLEQAARS